MLIVAVVAGTYIFGRVFGRAEELEPPASSEAVEEANAAAIAAGDVEALRFTITRRGYSPQEVDAALEKLFARLGSAERPAGLAEPAPGEGPATRS